MSWLVNINVYFVACLVPLLEFVLGTELDEELNSFVRTHCICWKLSIKKMETTACEWRIDSSLDIDTCLQMETPAGLKEIQMVLGKQMIMCVGEGSL